MRFRGEFPAPRLMDYANLWQGSFSFGKNNGWGRSATQQDASWVNLKSSSGTINKLRLRSPIESDVTAVTGKRQTAFVSRLILYTVAIPQSASFAI